MVFPLGRPHPDCMPDLNEALGWTGFRVDDVYGTRVGIVEDIYVDHDSDDPCWILVKLGRFSDAYALLPVRDAVAGNGHVWIPFEKDLIRRAPQIAAGMPLSQERERALCVHYGVMSSRGAEIAQVPAAALTAASVHGPPPVRAEH
jgi:PRC-barrel domain